MATARYRALTRVSYSLALIALADLARPGTHSFSFGPANLTTLERNGLTVAADDLAPVQEALRRVPGLVEVPG